MKDIKFKGWHKEKKIMFNVFGFDVNHVYPFKTEGLEIPPEREEVELLMDTGFKDETGKEIYEGDLLEFECDGDKFIDVIVFTRGSFALGENENNCDYGFVEYQLCEWSGGTIVGNIYQNPELLDSEK